MSAILERETFELSRALEFFSEKELTAQIGFNRSLWPLALLKELVDNALDACESANIPPVIQIEQQEDTLIVQDNGPGLPLDVIQRSLDYNIRVSDKTGYVSPSRGQQGNALKTLWAAPFVATGESLVVIETQGQRHEIQVDLNRIAQTPKIELLTVGDSDVKNGTRIKLHWSGIARRLEPTPDLNFYMLAYGFHDLNPHLTLTLTMSRGQKTLPASDPTWKHWHPSEPTAPHWYQTEQLRHLIALIIHAEQRGSKAKSVNEFIREFRGLTATAKARDVAAAANLHKAMLHDLVTNDDLDITVIRRLLTAMQEAARPVKPPMLGVIGAAHCNRALEGYDAEGIQYRAAQDTFNGLPYVLEVAFGILPTQSGRRLVTGINFTYALYQPFRAIDRALSEARVQRYDSVILLVHVACPSISFTDRGKTQAVLPDEVSERLVQLVKQVTKGFTAAKRQSDRNDKMSAFAEEELRKANQRKFISTKAAAWQVMEQAYLKASSGKKLPANARQIMYAARRQIIELTGKTTPWKTSAYFTQTLLPAYIEAHPEQTADWDVVYDVRGHLREPHTSKTVELGTLAVRQYIGCWRSQVSATQYFDVASTIETHGPANRYRYALFVEKEGFDHLIKSANIQARFDIAVMSTKGMSVTAARQLVEALSKEGVTILVIRDFDLYGFRIAHTLGHDTKRYRFKHKPKVIDLGLRLEDAQDMGLDSEEYDGSDKDADALRKYGATDKEIEFLTQKRTVKIKDEDGNEVKKTILPSRIELNAMDSQQFIDWLEKKLKKVGKKVIPEPKTLQTVWDKQWREMALQSALDNATANLPKPPPMPKRMIDRIRAEFTDDPKQDWTNALAEIAAKKRSKLPSWRVMRAAKDAATWLPNLMRHKKL